MNTDPIYHCEKIQHSLLVVYLYILRLPTQTSEIRQLNEVISREKIKTIFHAETQPLSLQVDQLINLNQNSPMQQIVNYIHEELIEKKSNVGLMFSEKSKFSLQIYLNFMVIIESKQFDQLLYQLFKPFYSNEQLKQYYNEIKKNHKVLDLTLPPKPKIVKVEQQKPIINNNHRIFNGYQKEQPNQLLLRSQMILGEDDQVTSELYQTDILIPPFISLIETNIGVESLAKSIQHLQLNNNQSKVDMQNKLHSQSKN